MIAYPTDDRIPFQVAIYNKDVRALVKENCSHDYFNDTWADTHYHEILAHNEDEARSVTGDKYPAAEGFVIESVVREELEVLSA